MRNYLFYIIGLQSFTLAKVQVNLSLCSHRSVHSSQICADYPRFLAMHATIRTFAVENRENGRRLGNSNEFECTRLTPSLQRQSVKKKR